MLKKIKEANLLATGVESFLQKQVGNQKPQSLDGLIDKKRIFLSKKVISQGSPTLVGSMELEAQTKKPMTFALTKCNVACDFNCFTNTFTKMPKGQIRLSISGSTQMNVLVPATSREDGYLMRASDLIFRFQKKVAQDAEMITYRLTEAQLEQSIDFNTVYFDDYVQLAIYQRGSTSNANFVCREKLKLRDLICG